MEIPFLDEQPSKPLQSPVLGASPAGKLTTEEERSTGVIKGHVYSAYWFAAVSRRTVLLAVVVRVCVRRSLHR
jgi:hypothetical protein